jgi:hypothetical protein
LQLRFQRHLFAPIVATHSNPDHEIDLRSILAVDPAVYLGNLPRKIPKLIQSKACAILLVVAACTELRPLDQRSAADGGAGVAGALAGSGALGGGSDEGISGAGGSAGTPGTGGESGSPAGASGTGDAAMPNDSGTASEPVDPEGPIEGRVIDYFENAVLGAMITLNGETVTTDGDGGFAFGPTPRIYSIGVAAETPRLAGTEQNGYLFVNLSRRNPTLQVYRGLPKRSVNVTHNVDGVTFPIPSTEKIPMDLAGDYGGFSEELASATVTRAGEWEGPSEVQGHAHAIHYVHAASSPQLPTAYLAHASQSVALEAEMTTSVTFNLSSTAAVLTASTVSGSVTGAGASRRVNDVFVRFPDDAAVRVISHIIATDPFSYLVPSIATSSIAVAAMRDHITAPPYAVAYVEGLSPGANDIELIIPAPTSLRSPATGETNVDSDTEFSWSGPDQVYMFVVDAVFSYDNFYVVTSEKRAKIPVDSVMLPSLRLDSVYEWSVRTHRKFATVDEATGPTGYLDSFCYGRLRGPRRDSSSHTESELRSFTTTL